MNTLEPPIVQTEVITHNFTHYTTNLIDIVLHKEVTLIIYLFKDGILDSPTIIQYKIEGEEYQQWGNDDTYIDTIVQRELDKLRNTN